MATAAVKLKILPESPDTDLEEIKKHGKTKIESHKGVLSSYIEEPIAFGLKALIAVIAWPEEKDTELIEQCFLGIPGVSSVDIIDYRRALG